MGVAVLLLGESGSGKSCSLRNFNPDEIGIFNVASKPLPFRKKMRMMNEAKYQDIMAVLVQNKSKCYEHHRYIEYQKQKVNRCYRKKVCLKSIEKVEYRTMLLRYEIFLGYFLQIHQNLLIQFLLSLIISLNTSMRDKERSAMAAFLSCFAVFPLNFPGILATIPKFAFMGTNLVTVLSDT